MKNLGIIILVLTVLVGMIGCSAPVTTSLSNTESQNTSITSPIQVSTITQTSIVTVTSTQVTESTPTSTTSTTLSTANIVANVIPAVVRVVTENGMGSGLIIDKTGYILTNNHVIADSKTINFILSDGRNYAASVVGRDEINDLAVLNIPIGNLPEVILGDSDKLQQGDEVIAIGYPLDLEGSATISKGIVSAFRTGEGVNYIQTDAAINPGNSGGALINSNGEVIGINALTIRVADELPIEGMNFAIAINSAKPIIPKLMAGLSTTSSTPTITWLTYTNNSYGYSIQYPSNWNLAYVAHTNYSSVSLFPLKDNLPIANAPLIIIQQPEFNPGESLDSYLNSIYLKPSNSDVVSVDYSNWQGLYPACKWKIYHDYSGSEPGYQINLCIQAKGYFYFLFVSISVSNYDSWSPTFDEILSTFYITR